MYTRKSSRISPSGLREIIYRTVNLGHEEERHEWCSPHSADRKRKTKRSPYPLTLPSLHKRLRIRCLWKAQELKPDWIILIELFLSSHSTCIRQQGPSGDQKKVDVSSYLFLEAPSIVYYRKNGLERLQVIFWEGLIKSMKTTYIKQIVPL